MADVSFRGALAAGIAQEMARDPLVYFIGEDIGAAGGVFKATVGLFEQFGPDRVRDTPISEQAIIGAAMGAAMTGLRPIAEIMFSDFLATCWEDRKSTRLNSSHSQISYAVFCLKKKNNKHQPSRT